MKEWIIIKSVEHSNDVVWKQVTAYPALNANLGFCFFESIFSVDFNIVISAHPGVKLYWAKRICLISIQILI